MVVGIMSYVDSNCNTHNNSNNLYNLISNTMTEFEEKRMPLYIDNNTLSIVFAPVKYSNTSHALWFNDYHYPFPNTLRGYYWGRLNKNMDKPKEEEEFVMLYWNNFDIPNITICILSYIFAYFPEIDWIGLGCHQGKDGERWEPQLKVTRQ